jgi:branched-chain amino acid transport system permease protein
VARFLQTVVDGLADGSIYGALALALVLIYRATGVINFAQGEMATCSTFIAWGLIRAGLPPAAALAATVVVSFLGGLAIERVVVRPVEGSDALTIVILTVGLYFLFNSADGWIWGFDSRSFPSLLSGASLSLAGATLTVQSLGTVAALLAVVALLYLFFQRTDLGLAMRAAAQDRDASRLAGVPVSRMLMLGWGLAATLGAIAGALVAPTLFLNVNTMGSVLIYAFAAAALGGLDSPVGAVIGGWIIGIGQNLAGTYVGFIGGDLEILVPLAIIVVVLLVRPTGLFGAREVVRV